MTLSHHAYYIEGPLSLFEEYKETLAPWWARRFERFGVEEARALIAAAELKHAGKTVFLMGAASLTSEAQQALLKLFEEPQEGVVFVMLVPHGALMSTLRSRMLEYPQPIPHATRSVSRADIAALIKSDDKDAVRDFLDALEAELYTKIDDPRTRQALEDIAMVRDYMRDRSPSLKMLLEHLAISLPRI